MTRKRNTKAHRLETIKKLREKLWNNSITPDEHVILAGLTRRIDVFFVRKDGIPDKQKNLEGFRSGLYMEMHDCEDPDNPNFRDVTNSESETKPP